jgi:dienelactone hydrolase
MSYSLQRLAEEGVPRLSSSYASIFEWLPKRNEIMNAWLKCMGGLPEREPVEYHVLSESKHFGHTRLHLSYKASYGDKVTAYLLIPDKRLGNEAKGPAVLALHPTTADGKKDTATEQGRENRCYGLELVNRGFVVLAPDTITAGERIYLGQEAFRTAPFYEQYPKWSAVGKMLSDHMYGVDLLVSLPYVKPQQIGAIGHSLGGYNAIFLAGIDRRIRAVVSSCGFSVFAGDPDPNRWGQRDWFSHLPALTVGIEHDQVPFDFNEIAALMAPTPWFCWNGQLDAIFPNWRNIAEAMADMDTFYKEIGAEGSLSFLMGNAGHDFPPHIRKSAYDFMEEKFRY